MMSLARGTIVVFAAQVIGNAGYLVAVLIIARGLGPDGRGTIAFVVVSALILSRVAAFGLTDGTLVFASQRPAMRPQLLSNLLVFTLPAGLIVAGIAAIGLLQLGSAAPGGVGPGEILLLVVGTVCVTVQDTTDNFLVGSGKIWQRAAVLAISPWVYAFVAAALLFAGALTVTSGAAAWALSNLFGAIALVVVAFRGLSFVRPHLPLLRESIGFGLRAWVGHLASFLNLRVDQIILGVIATQAALGIYAAAVNGSEVLLYFPAAVATTLVPTLARSDPTTRHEQALRTFRLLAITSAASIVAAAILGPVMLPLLFGPRFQTSVPPVLWLLPGVLGFSASRVFSSALLASTAAGRSSVGSITALGVGVVLDFILIPPFGAVGAGAAASAAFLSSGAITLLLYRHRMPFPWSSLIPGRADLALMWRFRTRVFGRGPSQVTTTPGLATDLAVRGAAVVFVSGIDWDFVWQAHQEIATRLAAAGNRVVFVETTGGVRSVRASDASRLLSRGVRVLRETLRGDRQPAPNITVIAPVLLPFARGSLAARVNDRILVPRLAAKIRRIAGPDPVIYTYLPTTNALRLIDLIGGPRSVVVYHAVTDYAEVSQEQDRMRESERELTRKADLVFVQSAGLAERLSPDNPRVHDLGIGVNLRVFDPATVSDISGEVRDLPRPILGYIGAIHQHIDFELLRDLARAFPHGSLVLAGPQVTDPGILAKEPNVRLLPARPHAALPALVAAFDVGLIPYRRSAYTNTVNPTKLYEYLAMGAPVVSTDLPEVVALQLPRFAVRTACDRQEFIACVHEALALDQPADRGRRRALALQRDWAVVVERIATAIAERQAVRS